ncbi:UNC-50 family-domain-containing protein [Gymnopilus junonius]|uniref:UNC-50 family-domain-containing protein n=1 Tax=Gymnopilus junonius TaxID=109634 RepID=A0A9P5NU36_GYMJU|nr:UNC-50 family-domain-containing protein [Gymnopilus junonius]
MVLPITSPLAAEYGRDISASRSSPLRVPVIFRRLHRFQQMDFELAAWQLTYLCLAPRRVYRNVYFHKQTKNTWARDDPAILVLIAACLCDVGLAALMIFRDFLLSGVVVATIIWFTANRLLLSPPSHSTPADSRVEWAYAFDVHTNAFFPLFLTLYLAQLFLLPIVLKDNWVSLPFLVRSELLLSPLLPLFTAYIASLLGFNVAQHVLRAYFR